MSPTGDPPELVPSRRSRELAALSRPPKPGLAELIADTGWGHADAPDVRVLVFGAAAVIIVIEVRRHPSGLIADGVVRPAPAPSATARPRRKGHIAAAALDAQGHFILPMVPPGPFSVAVTVAEPQAAAIATEWVNV